MPARAQWIRHTFNGGWATDFGAVFHGSPGQDGSIGVPWLEDAENLIYELDGGPHKMPGTTLLNSSTVGSSTSILGLFDYWRMGTSGSATQRRVIHAGTVIGGMTLSSCP